MKRLWVVFLVITAVIMSEYGIFARLTADVGQRDIICWGPSGAEVCIDASGNLIPTTDDDTDLGTSSLQWKNGYFDGTVYVDALENEGALTQTGATAFAGAVTFGGNVTIGDVFSDLFTIISGSMTVPLVSLRIASATSSALPTLFLDNTNKRLGIGKDSPSVALDVTGAGAFSTTLDVDGNTTIGAANYVSTFTASNGNLNVTGAIASLAGLSGTTGAFSSTLDVNGNVTLGADNYVTTNTAASGAWAFPATVSIGGNLTQIGNIYAGAANYVSTFTAASGAQVWTGALSGLSTLDINGNVYLGADNFVSTITAADGNWAITGNLVSLGNLSGVNGAFSGTLDVNGNATFGADNYVSTFTASNGNVAITGTVTSLAAVTGLSLTASGGQIGHYPRTKAQIDAITPSATGQDYYCSNCIDAAVCISSGTERGAFVQISSATVHCN